MFAETAKFRLSLEEENDFLRWLFLHDAHLREFIINLRILGSMQGVCLMKISKPLFEVCIDNFLEDYIDSDNSFNNIAKIFIIYNRDIMPTRDFSVSEGFIKAITETLRKIIGNKNFYENDSNFLHQKIIKIIVPETSPNLLGGFVNEEYFKSKLFAQTIPNFMNNKILNNNFEEKWKEKFNYFYKFYSPDKTEQKRHLMVIGFLFIWWMKEALNFSTSVAICLIYFWLQNIIKGLIGAFILDNSLFSDETKNSIQELTNVLCQIPIMKIKISPSESYINQSKPSLQYKKPFMLSQSNNIISSNMGTLIENNRVSLIDNFEAKQNSKKSEKFQPNITFATNPYRFLNSKPEKKIICFEKSIDKMSNQYHNRSIHKQTIEKENNAVFPLRGGSPFCVSIDTELKIFLGNQNLELLKAFEDTAENSFMLSHISKGQKGVIIKQAIVDEE